MEEADSTGPVDEDTDESNFAHALHTSTNELHADQDMWLEGDYKDILLQNLRSIGCEDNFQDWETLRAAAVEWNRQPTYYPSEMDYTIPVDENDIEDLEWSGPIDRSAYVLETCASPNHYNTRSKVRIAMTEKDLKHTIDSPPERRFALNVLK